MNFFSYTVPGPVPVPLDLSVLGWVSVVAVATALAPLWLVARQAIGFGAARSDRSRMRVVESGEEFTQRAA
jgi:hypothetical protein